MSNPINIRELPDYVAINLAIIEQFNQHRESEKTRRSHYFAGRYENIYLDIEKVPAMQTIIDCAHRMAQEILNTSQQLKSGFWFNLMGPGHVTQPHSHDDDDERLSAVYYIDIPQQSGDLLLEVGSEVIKVKPEAGRFVFFPPNISHYVTENKSNFDRLSVGMNFGIEYKGGI